nr:DUF308 domain-containing protein [uncultured Oscillibacter sp.]
MRKLHIARIGYNAVSVIFCLAAVLYLLFPQLPPLALCIFSGLLLLIYGIIKIVGYFSEDLFCLAFRYDLAFGLLLLAAGILLLVRHKTAVEYLPGGFGWMVLLDCFFKIQMSEEAKKFGLEQWSTISAAAVITGIIGLFLILSFSRQNAARILMILALLSEGSLNHCVVKLTVKNPEAHPALHQDQP